MSILSGVEVPQVHYFQIDYGNIHGDNPIGRSLEYYTMIIEGDRAKIEDYLKQYSADVRYNTSKDKSRNDNGNRVLAEGIVVRNCMWNYDMCRQGTCNQLPVDSRHTVLGGDAIAEIDVERHQGYLM